MSAATFLQWLGAAVAGSVVVVLAIIGLRLAWSAAARQWTKYADLKRRVSAVEDILFGPQHLPSNHGLVMQDHDVRYRVHECGMYDRLDDARRRSDAIKQRVADLESYRPSNIENPEDLR